MIVVDCEQCGLATCFEQPLDGDRGNKDARYPKNPTCQSCLYEGNMKKLKDFYMERYGIDVDDYHQYRRGR